MAEVECEIEEADLLDEDDPDRLVRGVIATCSHCEHTTEEFGTGEKSRLRCLARMRETCPEGERNFYIES